MNRLKFAHFMVGILYRLPRPVTDLHFATTNGLSIFKKIAYATRRCLDQYDYFLAAKYCIIATNP